MYRPRQWFLFFIFSFLSGYIFFSFFSYYCLTAGQEEEATSTGSRPVWFWIKRFSSRGVVPSLAVLIRSSNFGVGSLPHWTDKYCFNPCLAILCSLLVYGLQVYYVINSVFSFGLSMKLLHGGTASSLHQSAGFMRSRYSRGWARVFHAETATF